MADSRNIGVNFPRPGVRAYGAVIVPYTGAVRIFDVARVRLIYRWAGLGH